jgi:hypothetical protein
VNRWSTNVVGRLSDIALHHPEWLLHARSPNGGIVNAAFISSNTPGGLTGDLVQMNYNPSNIIEPVSKNILPLGPENCPTHYCGLGASDVAKEFVSATSERAKKEAEQWRHHKLAPSADRDAMQTVRLVELTIAYDKSGLVGGNVDAVMLKRGGKVEWIRSPDCQETPKAPLDKKPPAPATKKLHH